MAHREFSDELGRTWQAWDVIPTNDTAGGVVEPQRQRSDVGPERRRSHVAGLSVSPEMRHGWLAFRCRNESRRIAPIPPGWATLPDHELVVLLHSASPSARWGKI